MMSGSKHTMPESDEEVQKQVEAVFGFCPCLWMANPSCSSHPKWRGCNNYCTHGIWEVNDLLDAIVIHKTCFNHGCGHASTMCTLVLCTASSPQKDWSRPVDLPLCTAYELLHLCHVDGHRGNISHCISYHLSIDPN